MVELRRHLRQYVDRFPELGKTIRMARHSWRRHTSRPQTTQFGFRLVGNDAMVRGDFEPVETAALNRMFDTADVFVDVGANVGFYTCLAASRAIHAIAIEPLSDNLDFLYENLEENAFVNDVEVYPVGVGSAFGLLRLYGWDTGASFLPGWAGASPASYRTVPITTLDVLIGDRFRGKRLVVKVDVEGAELQVLQGAKATLDTSPRPRWLMEVCLTENRRDGANPYFAETFETFLARGYVARTLGDERRTVERSDVQRWVANSKRDFGTYNFVFE
jgi:FkbM family methyltransferase